MARQKQKSTDNYDDKRNKSSVLISRSLVLQDNNEKLGNDKHLVGIHEEDNISSFDVVDKKMINGNVEDVTSENESSKISDEHSDNKIETEYSPKNISNKHSDIESGIELSSEEASKISNEHSEYKFKTESSPKNISNKHSDNESGIELSSEEASKISNDHSEYKFKTESSPKNISNKHSDNESGTELSSESPPKKDFYLFEDYSDEVKKSYVLNKKVDEKNIDNDYNLDNNMFNLEDNSNEYLSGSSDINEKTIKNLSETNKKSNFETRVSNIGEDIFIENSKRNYNSMHIESNRDSSRTNENNKNKAGLKNSIMSIEDYQDGSSANESNRDRFKDKNASVFVEYNSDSTSINENDRNRHSDKSYVSNNKNNNDLSSMNESDKIRLNNKNYIGNNRNNNDSSSMNESDKNRLSDKNYNVNNKNNNDSSSMNESDKNRLSDKNYNVNNRNNNDSSNANEDFRDSLNTKNQSFAIEDKNNFSNGNKNSPFYKNNLLYIDIKNASLTKNNTNKFQAFESKIEPYVKIESLENNTFVNEPIKRRPGRPRIHDKKLILNKRVYRKSSQNIENKNEIPRLKGKPGRKRKLVDLDSADALNKSEKGFLPKTFNDLNSLVDLDSADVLNKSEKGILPKTSNDLNSLVDLDSTDALKKSEKGYLLKTSSDLNRNEVDKSDDLATNNNTNEFNLLNNDNGTPVVKRRPGRPKKNFENRQNVLLTIKKKSEIKKLKDPNNQIPKRGRGRPKRIAITENNEVVKRGRGRPKRIHQFENSNSLNSELQNITAPLKKRRGRKKRVVDEDFLFQKEKNKIDSVDSKSDSGIVIKKKRGRKKKVLLEEIDSNTNNENDNRDFGLTPIGEIKIKKKRGRKKKVILDEISQSMLSENNDTGLENASVEETKIKKKRGRKKKIILDENNHDVLNENNDDGLENTHDGEIKIKKKRGRKRKIVIDEIDKNKIDDENNLGMIELTPDGEVKIKKKRGRKKKIVIDEINKNIQSENNVSLIELTLDGEVQIKKKRGRKKKIVTDEIDKNTRNEDYFDTAELTLDGKIKKKRGRKRKIVLDEMGNELSKEKIKELKLSKRAYRKRIKGTNLNLDSSKETLFKDDDTGKIQKRKYKKRVSKIIDKKIKSNIKQRKNNYNMDNDENFMKKSKYLDSPALKTSFRKATIISNSSESSDSEPIIKNKLQKRMRNIKFEKHNQEKRHNIERENNVLKEIKKSNPEDFIIENIYQKNLEFKCMRCPNLVKNNYEICQVCKHVVWPKKTISVESIIAHTFPPGTTQIPLPDQNWRKLYPVHLKNPEPLSKIQISNTEIDIKYYKEFIQTKKLFFCDVCLLYLTDSISYNRHLIRCKETIIDFKNPLFRGEIVYHEPKNSLSIFEIDGENETSFCRNLCAMGKFFLDHKTLNYDVDAFLFYVLYEKNNFVGFFSKEKQSTNNLSCIVVLPIYQGKGYGYLLIDLSYKLCIATQNIGTPEKPLSSQGAKAYKNYWMCSVYIYLTKTLFETAHNKEIQNNRFKQLSLKKIGRALGMTVDDLVYALELLGMLDTKDNTFKIVYKKREMKIVRGCIETCLFI